MFNVPFLIMLFCWWQVFSTLYKARRMMEILQYRDFLVKYFLMSIQLTQPLTDNYAYDFRYADIQVYRGLYLWSTNSFELKEIYLRFLC